MAGHQRYADPEAARKASRDRWNAANKDERRSWSLRKRYGIDAAAHAVIIAAQNNLCPVCGTPLDLTRPRAVHTDHIHGTRVIRGVIHAACNTAIGRLGDDVDGLTRALIYVSGAVAPATTVDEHW